MGEVRATKRTDYSFPEDRKFVEQIITPAVLRNGSWSGEIRFRHFNTAVILPPGDSLEAPLAELQRPITTAGAKTLERAEREHIMKVLDEAKWVIGGPNGAAARLGLKRTTLLYKLAKLGISREKI